MSEDVESEPKAKINILAKWRALSRAKKIWVSSGLVLVLLLVTVNLVKPWRLAALNFFSDANITVLVLDQNTEQPVYEATVTIGNESVQTDLEGKALISDIDYGDTDVLVDKDAYASSNVTTTVDSANYVLEISLEPTGIPVSFKAVNWVNDESLAGFTVTNEEKGLSAQADEAGVATVNIPPNSGDSLDFEVTLDGFNKNSATISLVDEEGKSLSSNQVEGEIVKLVPEGKHYFLSNRAGEVNVYSSNLDGSDAEIVIDGTGEEKGHIPFVVSEDNQYAAMIASREGRVKKSWGSDLSEVYAIDLVNKTITLVDKGDTYFDLIGLEGSKIYYEVSYYSNKVWPNNQKIKSYDFATGQLATLFSSQEINTPVLQAGKIFFGEQRNKTKHWSSKRVRNNIRLFKR